MIQRAGVSLSARKELVPVLLRHKIYGDLDAAYLIMRANEETKDRLLIKDKATAIAVLMCADRVKQWSPPWYRRLLKTAW